jgi:SNF2 family DNA or RNA helicase
MSAHGVSPSTHSFSASTVSARGGGVYPSSILHATGDEGGSGHGGGWVKRRGSAQAMEDSLSKSDKEERLLKLLQRSDKIVARLTAALPSSMMRLTTPSANTTSPSAASLVEDSSSDRKESIQPYSGSGAIVSASASASEGRRSSSGNGSGSHGTSEQCDGTEGSTLVQPSSIMGCKLRPYQLQGMEWLCGIHASGLNGILADEMGLGKILHIVSGYGWY